MRCTHDCVATAAQHEPRAAAVRRQWSPPGRSGEAIGWWWPWIQLAAWRAGATSCWFGWSVCVVWIRRWRGASTCGYSGALPGSAWASWPPDVARDVRTSKRASACRRRRTTVQPASAPAARRRWCRSTARDGTQPVRRGWHRPGTWRCGRERRRGRDWERRGSSWWHGRVQWLVGRLGWGSGCSQGRPPDACNEIDSD